jgi:hypothetical protein
MTGGVLLVSALALHYLVIAFLRRYCKQHPDANLIDASEQILKDLDRGP